MGITISCEPGEGQRIIHASLVKVGAGDMVTCPICAASIGLWDPSARCTVTTRYACGSVFLWGHHSTIFRILKPAVIQIRLHCIERYKQDPTGMLPLIPPARWKHHLKKALNYLWFD